MSGGSTLIEKYIITIEILNQNVHYVSQKLDFSIKLINFFKLFENLVKTLIFNNNFNFTFLDH